jgi:hypothetical protein
MNVDLDENEMSNSNLLYENIPPFKEETNFVELMIKVKKLLRETKEHEWIEHVQAINYLRRLRKYEKEIFDRVMYDLNIFEIILSYLNSVRTTLSKITLVFIKELFSEYEFEYNDNDEQIELIKFIKFITPKLILKANSEKSFLKDEAINCLNNLSKNMTYGDTLIALIKVCITNNGNSICELSFNFIQELLKNFDINYLIYFDYWDEFFEILIKILKMKKEPYMKKSILLINSLENLIGKDNFENILKNNCNEEEKNFILKSINNSYSKSYKLKKEKNKENKISDLIKEQRNQFKKQSSQEIEIKVLVPKKN